MRAYFKASAIAFGILGVIASFQLPAFAAGGCLEGQDFSCDAYGNCGCSGSGSGDPWSDGMGIEMGGYSVAPLVSGGGGPKYYSCQFKYEQQGGCMLIWECHEKNKVAKNCREQLEFKKTLSSAEGVVITIMDERNGEYSCRQESSCR